MLGIGHFLDRNATMLSGGEQQRVALARSLVYEPGVLLLDEPLSNLDAKIRREVRVELRQIQQNVGVTVIYVTHDQEEAMVLGDQVVVLRDGLVQQTGPPVSLYSEPINRWVASFLGSANVLENKSVHRVGDKIEVETVGGLKIQAEPPQWDPTEARYLCIRREHILISEEGKPPADPKTNLLPAEIVGVEFVGDRCEVEVKVAEEKLRIYSSERFMVGHKVSINLPSRSVRLLRE
jgi:iron(III) transport system ATP-binding protein